MDEPGYMMFCHESKLTGGKQEDTVTSLEGCRQACDDLEEKCNAFDFAQMAFGALCFLHTDLDSSDFDNTDDDTVVTYIKGVYISFYGIHYPSKKATTTHYFDAASNHPWI